MLAPAPNREFGPQDTINFDWFWPTIPAPGRQFTVYLIDGLERTALGSLTAPNNGSAYRLPVAVAELPTDAEEVAWQIRLETIADGEVVVTSDEVPLRLLPQQLPPTETATATSTPTPTATATSTVCVKLPPPGWVIYVVRQGDALARLAQNGNVPIGTVMRVNCLVNDLLSVGQQLWLPSTAATVAAPIVNTPAPQPTATSGSGGGGGGGGVQPATPVPTSVPATLVPPTDTPPTVVPDPPTSTPPPA